MPENDFTAAEQRFIGRCARARVPVNVVEYQLALAAFDIREKHASAGRSRNVYALAWRRIRDAGYGRRSPAREPYAGYA